jgi:hypothetical protein
MNRYFYVTYNYLVGQGWVSFETKNAFPSLAEITEIINEKFPETKHRTCTIVFLYEFKTKEDWENFNQSQPNT